MLCGQLHDQRLAVVNSRYSLRPLSAAGDHPKGTVNMYAVTGEQPPLGWLGLSPGNLDLLGAPALAFTMAFAGSLVACLQMNG